MEPHAQEKLTWPPLADDLRRLYIDEQLSAAKIADRYGLKFASRKTAESTILYHLKKNGIWRRDKNELSTKVTEEMAVEWTRRYEAGESLKRIASDKVNHVTIYNHLKKRGVKLRDKVEAQIKAVTIHEKVPFNGGSDLKAYLTGIAIGDYWATGHGRATRVKLSTTHPAMTELFRQLFENYGPIYEYPRTNTLTGFEWSLDCDLDKSFEFLRDAAEPPNEIFVTERQFLNFLAGFFDAEGSIWYHEGGSFEVSMSNINQELVEKIGRVLNQLGFSPKIFATPQRANPRITGKISELIWILQIWKRSEVPRFLELVPIRHPEKKEKARIALKLFSSGSAQEREVLREWEECKDRIEKEVNEYVEKARLSMIQKSGEV